MRFYSSVPCFVLLFAALAHAAPACLDLGGAGWELRQLDKPDEVTAATVPGSVHTDLLAAKKIPDPFFRENEKPLQWISNAAWSYTKHFNVPAEVLNHEHVELRCDGLETLAHLKFNGQPLGNADNMFRTWTFDVKNRLHAGENVIAVTFSPLKPYIKSQGEKFKGKGPGMFVNGLGEVRTEICSNGWDFGSKFVTAGIWKPIGIVTWDTAKIANVGVVQDLHDASSAKLTVQIDADGNTAQRAKVDVSFAGKVVDSKTVDVQTTGKAELAVSNPQLWWPAGMGAQPMYDVNVELQTKTGEALDRITKRIGLRTIELLPKSASRPLGLQVNGRPVFSRGAAWVPCEMFPTQVTHQHLYQLLSDAKSANFNFIRCWGGGYYEEDDFYNICDELGLMVWCDFKFACSAYPASDPAFMDNVKHEFDDNIHRLRHHPSIAVWSGNNEVEGLVTGYKVMRQVDYDKLFHQLFTSEIHALVPNGATVPGSPEMGDEHNWWVWHVGANFEKYLEGHGWMTEFGFQSYPEPRTVATYTMPEDRASTLTPVMKFHERNGNNRGSEMILEMMGRYYRPAKDFDSTLWLSQINQAMGMSLGIRHWRTDWPASTGAFVWQYDDIWPGPSWSVVDYFCRWKAAMYSMRHDYAPQVIFAQFDPKTGDVHADIANDTPAAVTGELHWALTDLSGTKIDGGMSAARLSPGTSSTLAWRHSFAQQLDKVGRKNAMLWFDLIVDGKSASKQTLLFARPKALSLLDPKIRAEVSTAADGFDVTLTVDHPALYAWLDLGADAHYSDNFVDLPAGEPMRIRVIPAAKMSLNQFKQSLKVRSLYDTYDPAAAAAAKPVAQSADGTLVATAADADIVGDSAKLEKGAPPNIGAWTNFDDYLQWTVHVDKPGAFRVSASTALPGTGGGFTVSVAGDHVDGVVPNTGGWNNYKPTDLGVLHVNNPGEYTLTLRPKENAGKGNVMNFRSLTLKLAE